MGTVLTAIAVLAATTAIAVAAERAGQETYVVRHGDTLAKIAERVFGDARRWREILKENPQVTNANRIYPGDSLLVPAPLAGEPAVPVPETAAAQEEAAPAAGEAAAAAAESAAAPAAEELVPELPVESVRSVAVVNPALYRSAGYIADELPAVAIIASPEERILLSAGDAAIVNAPIAPGRRFSVVRAERRVFHPHTGECLGWLTRVLGSAEVTCANELSSTVVLRETRDAAGVGDYLVPLDPEDVLEENLLRSRLKPGCLAAGPEDAVIVAFDDDQPAIGERELAYLDRGASSGVVPGKRFVIYHEVFPDARVAIGELQVLRAGERTSTALITASTREVQVGSLLRLR